MCFLDEIVNLETGGGGGEAHSFSANTPNENRHQTITPPSKKKKHPCLNHVLGVSQNHHAFVPINKCPVLGHMNIHPSHFSKTYIGKIGEQEQKYRRFIGI